MTIERTRRGYALPSTILVMLLMTGGVVAGFTRAAADARTNDNNRAETAAFAVAEAGLQRYLARGRTTPIDTTMVLDGGTARVRLTPVHTTASGDSMLYVIRSDGVVAGRGHVPPGSRTVAQYAYHVRGRVRLPAMWTSMGTLNKAGTSGLISGFDGCLSTPIAGIVAQDAGYTYSGDFPEPVAGNPAHVRTPDLAALQNEVKIDWNGLTNPAIGNVDVIVCRPGTVGYDPGLGPCGQWPLASAWTTNSNYWPAILINGSSPLPTNGRGTLIVTGELVLGGGQEWDGIIMVGDRLVDNGGGRVTGGVVTGLNATKGSTVRQSLANGTKNYQYNSCTLARAADRQSRFLQISNAWVDNWAAW
jgi:hypothetical protein